MTPIDFRLGNALRVAAHGMVWRPPILPKPRLSFSCHARIFGFGLSVLCYRNSGNYMVVVGHTELLSLGVAWTLPPAWVRNDPHMNAFSKRRDLSVFGTCLWNQLSAGYDEGWYTRWLQMGTRKRRAVNHRWPAKVSDPYAQSRGGVA